MATTIPYGAVYGTAIYGVDRYGVNGVTVIPDGVQMSITSDSGVVISGDANHVVVSLVSPSIVGGVGVVGVAVTSTVGVEANVLINDAIDFKLDCKFDLDGVETPAVIGDAVVTCDANTSTDAVSSESFVGNLDVIGDSNFEMTGVDSTVILGNVTQKTVNRVPVDGYVIASSHGSVTIIGVANIQIVSDQISVRYTDPIVKASTLNPIDGYSLTSNIGEVVAANNARPTFVGIEAFINIGNALVSTTAFDYPSVAALYDRTRTVYVSRHDSSSDRKVMVPLLSRVVHVDKVLVPTSYKYNVAQESRKVYTYRKSNSADRSAIVR